MRTRNIASVQQNTLHRLWYKAAQRDRIRLRLLERLVFTIGIQSGAFYIVQIKEKFDLVTTQSSKVRACAISCSFS